MILVSCIVISLVAETLSDLTRGSYDGGWVPQTSWAPYGMYNGTTHATGDVLPKTVATLRFSGTILIQLSVYL